MRLRNPQASDEKPLELQLQIDIEASGFDTGELSVVLSADRLELMPNSLHETLMLLPCVSGPSGQRALERRLHRANLVSQSRRPRDRARMTAVQRSQLDVIVNWLDELDCNIFSVLTKAGTLSGHELPDAARFAYSRMLLHEDVSGSVRLAAHVLSIRTAQLSPT